VLTAASDVDTALAVTIIRGRGLIIAPEPDSRARTEAAAAQLGDAIATLRALVGDSAAQQTAIDRLQTLIDARLAVLRTDMDLAADGQNASLRRHVQSHEGRDLTAQITEQMGKIRAEAAQQLVARQHEADAATRRTVAALVACGAVAAISLFATLTLLLGRRRERAHLSELRRAEALLRTVMQTTPGLIYAKDLQGRMIAANAAVLGFLHKPWSALQGRTDREIHDDPAEGEALMANDRQVIAEGRTLVVEERVGTEGRRARIWLSTKTPMRDADGAIVGMVGVSLDITERKQSEERLQAFTAALEARVAERTAALAASESRQRAYFEHAPIGVLVMRAEAGGDFVLEDINPAARAAFGFAPDRVRGLRHWQLWPELVAREKQEKMRACAARQEIVAYSVERTISGRRRLLDVVLAPMPDDGDGAQCVLVCVNDATERRALERKLVEHAERQAEAAECETALFTNSADELFIVRVEHAADGPAFVYEAFSPALETITGLRAEDLVGRRPTDCLPAPIAQKIMANYRCCLQEQATVKFAETRQLPSGQRDVEGWVSPVRHQPSGRIVRLVGSVRDVTERNRLEAALRQAQKMEAIGRLAAGVAHDFNNILQAIIGGLDLVMEETAAGTPARDFAGIAIDAAMRGSHLTHHLLCYARKQMLWPQAIDLATFLPDIRTLLTRTLGPHIVIDLRVRKTPHALADPGELQTALLNLAINAAHAMPKGGTLSIEADVDRAAGPAWVRIAVTDTGAGMDAATLAQAIEPFFTTKGVGGTGLGLSMVQGFVEQSGGRLRIGSVPGQGTSVTLALPAAGPAHRPAAPAPAVGLRVSGRILLVDDSTDVLVTVGAFLERAGFEVVRADSGDHALAVLAQDRRFDALVSDYAMPGLNGADLIAEARLLLPGLNALIITGYADIEDAGMAVRGAAVLHKPFQRDTLLDALLRVMGRDAARTPAVQGR
jgi:PAS domain S-box-containing protein